MLVLDADPNPFAEGLAKNAQELIEGMLDKFEVSKMSVCYGNIIKLMSKHPELINHFLRINVLKSLSSYVMNSVFDISSEAMSALEEILFSENKVEETVIVVQYLFMQTIPAFLNFKY